MKIKFENYKYERPDILKYQQKIRVYLDKIGTGKTAEEEISAIKKYHELDDEISSMITLASIRNSLNTKDSFYEEEQKFFDENMPYLQEIANEFTNKLLASLNRDKLEKEFGKLIFTQAEVAKKTFSVEIIEDLKQENKLQSEYVKLISSAEIQFEGKVYNLSQMAPFNESLKREVRKKASLAVSKFFNDNLEKFDQIYDDLVKVRNVIAKKLGYKSFVQLGYDRLMRSDYNYKDVEKYRKAIFQKVVPVAEELAIRKAKRLKIKNPQSYDLALSFLSGNPIPKGDEKWQVAVAKKMYEEMSSETNEFFNFMLNSNLLDLSSKANKAAGGYCTYIPKYQSPFIFANFNGTSHDVDVLTHEAGHAFQIYQSRHLIPEYRWPTMESAEIHSMSMEFFAWPWIQNFFKEETLKYKFNHLAGAISFIPYGALVDHFQHEVYENVELTGAERRYLWRKLEKAYLPFKKYDEDEFLKNGGFWFRQGHIFSSPFYYIDYTLAQVCAFQYWIKSQENYQTAWESYLSLCQQGGSKSFLELIAHVNLKNPFNDGIIEEIIKPIKKYLDSINDLEL